MRLWHKDLIPVLPDKQLLAQWRECVAISGNIKRLGHPNHILVNKIMDYHLSHFYKYCVLVTGEMHNRGFKVNPGSILKVMEVADLDTRMGSEFIPYDVLFSGWHNNRYLWQCIYNLQEKYDCSGITESEWQRIKEVVNV